MKCPCGHPVSRELVFPVVCRCGRKHVDHGSLIRVHDEPVDCQFLGTEIAEAVGSRMCDVVKLFECSKFKEIVANRTPTEIQDKVAREIASGYTGRSCSVRCWKSVTIAAITCFFNPQRSRSRVIAYERFRESWARHGIDLFTIEAGFPGQFDLTGVADWQVELHPEAFMFHKESLLNLAMDRLPDRYDAVMWVDADILFKADDYRDKIVDALSRYQVVQPWSTVQLHGPHGLESRVHSGIVAAIDKVGLRKAWLSTAYPGLAWCMPRETISKIGGLYQYAIAGGGDTAFAAAVFKDFAVKHRKLWGKRMWAHYSEWRQRVKDVLGDQYNRVGYVECDCEHLYHGKLKNRQYRSRYQIVYQCRYNPSTHIKTMDNGTMAWSARAPKRLRDGLRRYIHSRKEDQHTNGGFCLIERGRVIGDETHRSGWPYAYKCLLDHEVPNGVLLDDFVEQTFVYRKRERARNQVVHREPWVGVFHSPPEPSPCVPGNAIEDVLSSKSFLESAEHLKLAITLSKHLKRELSKRLSCPVVSIKIPGGTPPSTWTPGKWLRGERTLVQVGWTYRNLRLIYQIPDAWFGRVRLKCKTGSVGKYVDSCERMTIEHWRGKRVEHNPDGVIEIDYASNDEYDELLRTGVVAMEVFDASASTALVDAIIRHTPIVVNPHPAIQEYLGKDYPLYFNCPREIPSVVTDERVLAAHAYLADMDLSWADGNVFATKVKEAISDHV